MEPMTRPGDLDDAPGDLPATTRPPAERRSRRRRILVWAATVLGVTLIVGLVAGRALLLPRYHFPPPSGPFGIGTSTLHLVDTERAELLGPNLEAPRELMVQFWYPTERDTAGRGQYLSDPDEVIPALARLFGLPRFVLGHLRGVRTNAVDGAPVAGTGRFPVVLMLSGTGGFRQSTTFLVEHLVSHGFVVAGIDLPYASAAVVFPDGRVAEMSPLDELRPLVRQSYMPGDAAPTVDGVTLDEGIVPYFGEDVSFVIDELERLDSDVSHPLAGRLDLQRIGVAGVSLGGIVVGEVAREDRRVRAAVALDAAMPLRTAREGLDVPTMWITRPPETMRLERERAGGWPEEEIEAHHRTMRATFDSMRAPGHFVQVPGISHLDFTDAPSWAPALRWMGLAGHEHVAYAHGVIRDYTLAFFGRYLDGRDVSLDRLADTYPAASVESVEP